MSVATCDHGNPWGAECINCGRTDRTTGTPQEECDHDSQLRCIDCAPEAFGEVPAVSTWYHTNGEVCPDFFECTGQKHVPAHEHMLKPEHQAGTVGEEIVDSRREVYGAVVPTFIRIALAWSAILDHEVHAHEVALCMDALKSIRAAQAPDFSDNVDDKDGYMKIFREIIGDAMIEARSVAEYVEKRDQRNLPPFVVPEPSLICMHCGSVQPEHGQVHKNDCPVWADLGFKQDLS